MASRKNSRQRNLEAKELHENKLYRPKKIPNKKSYLRDKVRQLEAEQEVKKLCWPDGDRT